MQHYKGATLYNKKEAQLTSLQFDKAIHQRLSFVHSQGRRLWLDRELWEGGCVVSFVHDKCGWTTDLCHHQKDSILQWYACVHVFLSLSLCVCVCVCVLCVCGGGGWVLKALLPEGNGWDAIPMGTGGWQDPEPNPEVPRGRGRAKCGVVCAQTYSLS